MPKATQRFSPRQVQAILKKAAVAIAAGTLPRPALAQSGFFTAFSDGLEKSINAIVAANNRTIALGRSDTASDGMNAFFLALSQNGTVHKAVDLGDAGNDELFGAIFDGGNVTAVGRGIAGTAHGLFVQTDSDLANFSGRRITSAGNNVVCYNVAKASSGYAITCWTDAPGSQDVGYIFLNSDLTLNCATTFGTAMADEGRALSCDGTGTCYVVGLTRGGADAGDWILARLDNSCSVTWAQRYDSGVLEEPEAIDADGTLIAAVGRRSVSGTRPVLAVFDQNNGNVLGAVEVGTSGSEQAVAVRIRGSEIHVAGWGENVPLAIGGTTQGQALLWMTFDANNLSNMTAHVLDTPDDEVAKALSFDSEGNLVMGGHVATSPLSAVIAKVTPSGIDFCSTYQVALPSVNNITFANSAWSISPAAWTPSVSPWTPASMHNLSLTENRLCPNPPVTTGTTGSTGTSLAASSGALTAAATAFFTSAVGTGTTGRGQVTPPQISSGDSGSSSGSDNFYLILASALAAVCVAGVIAGLFILRRRRQASDSFSLTEQGVRPAVAAEAYPLVMNGEYEKLLYIRPEDVAAIEGLYGKPLPQLSEEDIELIQTRHDIDLAANGDLSQWRSGILGAGNFGHVYLVRKGGQLYALKEVQGKVACSESENENRVMFKIAELNLTSVVSIIQHEGNETRDGRTARSVMPLYSLGDARHLRTGLQCLDAPLRAQFCLYFASQLFHTTAELLRAGIMHFDMKLDNLLMPFSRLLQLVVGDFGLAKQANFDSDKPYAIQDWNDTTSYFLIGPSRLAFQKEKYNKLLGKSYDSAAHFDGAQQVVWEAALCILELYLGYNPFYIPRRTPNLAERIMHWTDNTFQRFIDAIPRPSDPAGQALFGILRQMLTVHSAIDIHSANQLTEETALQYPVSEADQAQLFELVLARTYPRTQLIIPDPPVLTESATAAAAAQAQLDYQSLEAAEIADTHEAVYGGDDGEAIYHTEESAGQPTHFYNTGTNTAAAGFFPPPVPRAGDAGIIYNTEDVAPAVDASGFYTT